VSDDLSGFDSHKGVGGAVQQCPLVWIEVELLDEDNDPVPDEEYEIETPDGRVVKGKLDHKGFARLDGLIKGSCRIRFPRLDKRSWEKI
jgi:hypothetical protein